jgi:tetratricopeptide (TPR) repeat protein
MKKILMVITLIMLFCTACVKIDPNDAAAYDKRGIAYYNKWEYDKAIANYTQVISINPNNASTYYNRGTAYSASGDYDRAIEDYTQAISINPNYADAYCARGDAYSAKGEHDKAIADYTEAIRLWTSPGLENSKLSRIDPNKCQGAKPAPGISINLKDRGTEFLR